MSFWAVVCPNPHLGRKSGTHPFAAIFTCVGKHFLQGSHREGLFQHKIADAEIWRNILWR